MVGGDKDARLVGSALSCEVTEPSRSERIPQKTKSKDQRDRVVSLGYALKHRNILVFFMIFAD